MFFALLVVAALARPIVDLELIRQVNAPNSGATWVAGVNEKFVGVDLAQAKSYLGVIPSHGLSEGMKTISTGRNDLPDEYDASKEHPGCIVAIRDQKQCGSCWAFGCSESLSDRFNIREGTCEPSTQVLLSPQDLVSCDKQQQGCNGGWPIKAWAYTNKTGLTPDTCDPYTSGGGQTGVCKVKPGGTCPGDKKKAVFYHTGEGYRILGEEAMQTDIYEKGPIEVVFEVYNDFFNYKSGVYHHVSGGLAGYHAVKMIGWGNDKKAGPYWIVYNSWGTGWGQKGIFLIKRGTNECKIEKPDDDKPDLCNSAAEAGEITYA